MPELLIYIQNHIEYAPYLIFGLLLLAGFNIPIPEDGMLFVSALLASRNPEYLPQLFAGVYLGAYLSDLICYGLGRIVGPKLLKIKFFAGIAKPERIKKIHDYYERYGVVTLIFGRFIPFGVRNGLFLTAGFGRMSWVKFALSDLLACTISSVTYFTLYYRYGASVIDFVKEANTVIFIAALTIVGFLYFRKRKTRQD
ncbi:DedA family protein [Methylomonas sp. MgM2]